MSQLHHKQECKELSLPLNSELERVTNLNLPMQFWFRLLSFLVLIYFICLYIIVSIWLTDQHWYEDQITKTDSSLHSLNMDLSFIHLFICLLIQKHFLNSSVSGIILQAKDSFIYEQILIKNQILSPGTFPRL